MIKDFKKYISKKGFTLAEVLITLGIIGVVAAMTIPTLIQKNEEKVTATKVKKMYSILSQAYLMNKAKDEINLELSQTTNDAAAREVAAVFVPYLRITKDCQTSETGCMYSGMYKYKSGSNHAQYDVGGYSAYRVLLQDGASIWFRRWTPDFYNVIFYDVNGPKDPNTWGKDLFYFQIVNDRVLPMGAPGTAYSFESQCSASNATGHGCTAWVINHGNMDYLKCSGLQLNGPKITCN